MKRITICIITFLLIATWSYGAEYYVSPTGAGSNDGSSWANAWAPSNIPWSSLESGSTDHTIYFEGGSSGITYSGSSSPALTVRHASTSNRVFLKPGSASPSPSGHAGSVTFTSTGSRAIQMGDQSGNKANNVTIDGETTSGAGTINITVGPASYDGIYHRYADETGNVYRYLEVTGTGTGANDTNAFQDDGTTSDVEIAYCYIHGNTNRGIRMSGTNAEYGDIKIHHSTFINNLNDSINCSMSCDIYNNTIDGTGSAPGTHPDGLQADTTGVSYLRLYNNVWKDHTQEIFMENASSATMQYILIYNNVFYFTRTDTTAPAILMRAKSDSCTIDNLVIANNTIVGMGLSAFRLFADAPYTGTVTNSLFVNNLLLDNNSNIDIEPPGGLFGTITWANDAAFEFDYNVLNSPKTLQWIVRGGRTSYSGTDSSQWASDHPTFSHNSVTAPPLVNKAGHNYHLRASLPGKHMASFYTTDKDGKTRREFSIGAYEYSTEIPPPNNLRIVP